MTDFTTRGTMVEAMLNTAVGAGAASTEVAPETLGMMLLLLQGNIITSLNMDRMLVSKEQVLVALVRQLVAAGMGEYTDSLMKGVTSEEGRAAVPWEGVMMQFKHDEVPASWREHTLGCLDKKSKTRLEVAIEADDAVAAVSFLMSRFGAFGCGRIGRDGSTALMLAARNGREWLCETMLKMFGVVGCSGASVEDKFGETALIRACGMGMEAVALKLVEKGPEACSAKQPNVHGSTALILACRKSMEAVALKLAEMGSETCNAKQVNKYGDTALILACSKGMEDVALKLAEMGAEACSAKQVDKYGDTALIWACMKGMEAVALKLVEMDPEACSAKQVNKYGVTALIWACLKGMERVALKLVEMGPDACNAKQGNEHGSTALIWACFKGIESVALKLLDMGAEACNAHQVGNKRNTALFWACKNQLVPVALKLLAFGKDACNAAAVNDDGDSARSIAAADPSTMQAVLTAMGNER